METEDTQLQKGFALFQQGRHSSAKRIFERLIRQNPNNCDALHYLGIVKASTGELPEAKQLIERSLSNGRTYLPYVENYVMILLEAGEHQRAVQLTTQTIESMAQTEKLRYVRALSLYKLRRLEDAAKECDALLRLAPNNFDGHVQKAVTLTEMGLYDEALACIERALRINPGHAQALINKANIVGALGKHDEAIGLYLQTLELNSFIPNALIGLARALSA